ncbi:MAG: hypothetical protein R3293_17850, partial [Candidatus Promineifilaceae bacterium]|nr:hypothetical protein [Candidatus Promineifilaceae bacterium]
RFIFRRMTIFAGEDVGMADPHAVTIVTGCWSAFERIGMPEGRFPLAQAAIYLATAPKSNSAFAFFDALEIVENEAEVEVPNHLKDGNRDKEGFGHGKGYLYPHAYRDHWVAQQYLPESLQGKVFYQPGNLGYEKAIQSQVARRREAQLSAMVEGAIEAPPEILTTSPTDRARDIWLQRAIAGMGHNLAQQRERLFELAKIQRHHLILDINAGSGLLTWEAVRQVPEGGVWSLAFDATSGEALRQQAMKLADLDQPVVMIGKPEEIDYLMTLRNEEDIRFDRIIGRNVFTRSIASLPEQMGNLIQKMKPAGLLCFSQVIPQYTQRLYKLVDWSGHDELRTKVAEAEELIYKDPHDALVSWNETDLEMFISKLIDQVDVLVDRQNEERHISERQIESWFQLGESSAGRLSYGQRLINSGLTLDELEQAEFLYRRSLFSSLIPWNVTTAYIKAGSRS